MSERKRQAHLEEMFRRAIHRAYAVAERKGKPINIEGFRNIAVEQVHLQHSPPAGNGGAGMRRIVVGAAVLGSLAGFIEPADACHHFRYWGYKTPQRCGVAPHRRVAVRSHPVVKVVSRPSTAAPPAPKPETAVPRTVAPLTLPPAIPLNMTLPGLTDVVSSAVWGAEPDEETRVRMLTHAAFSSASPPSAARSRSE